MCVLIRATMKAGKKQRRKRRTNILGRQRGKKDNLVAFCQMTMSVHFRIEGASSEARRTHELYCNYPNMK